MNRAVFVHIGDVHLIAAHPRNQDRLAALDQIIRDNVSRADLAAWLIPGDLFHQKSTPADRNDLAERLSLMAAAAPVVLTRGNHDAIGDLEIFARLKAAWPIYVFTRPGVYDVPLPTGEVAAIAVVPYPDKAGLVARGIAAGDVPETATQLLDIIFMQLASELSLARVSGAVPLFMGHFNTRGATTSSGQPQIGHEQEVDRASLQRLPAVYFALSHIHEPQEVGVGVYAGSIAAMDYGEISPRSYVLIEATREIDWSATWTRRPIHTPPMYHVQGVLAPQQFSYEVVGGDAPTNGAAIDWTGCDVRVRYTYRASERPLLDEQRITREFAGALRLKIEGIAIPDRALRAPEVAAAKTLPEKLAAYQKVPQLAPTVADKLQLLETKDADQVLVDVAAALKGIEQPAREEAMVAV